MPDRQLIAGNPARAVKELPDSAILWRNNGDGEYQHLAGRSLASLVECEPLSEPEPDRPRNVGDARAVRLSANAS